MERDNSNTVLGIVIGTAVGAIAALLLAPTSGQETRKRITEQFSASKRRASQAAGRVRERRTARPVVAEGKIDLNNATREELMEIEGIGPSTADDIIKYREAHGGFESVDELDNVYGFGRSMIEKVREHVYI